MKQYLNKICKWFNRQFDWLAPVLFLWTAIKSPLFGKSLDWFDAGFLVAFVIFMCDVRSFSDE
ncbi:MAG: hypothetical protein EBR82_81555 [Caulobacteraceae bacterium]|nr:hypothetical protein [Caulobacteraceae bacterium]